jgi:transcriptional regulator with XRE-family HTH domain
MQKARMIGNYVEQLSKKAGVSTARLGDILGCSENQAYSFIKGRSFVSFEQISKLASSFGVSVSAILKGDQTSYNESVVHCMNNFDDTEKREKILDLIDDYMDIVDALGTN